ncbi:MAG: vitamin B12-dependent ribonucleotide reductase [Deltaproteobacteria bacterium]|nr:vitamin B12-dependent ribonucleotide reductase [Deltaproteobacteria bacterium]
MLDKQVDTSGKSGTEMRQVERKRREPRRAGISIKRFFTEGLEDPFAEVKWEKRDALISGADGQVIFEQRDVEVPSTWSQMATNVVVQKYFRGQLGTPGRETSVRQLISRVADTITSWGVDQNYFASAEDAEAFRFELTYLLVTQRAAFNSPVWFNVGVEEHPQCSACFINSVDDTMDSILDLAKTEGMLFKWGSGTGTNFSSLRSSQEFLTGGGLASGPVSFMRGFDAFAGVIKSGGKTRRAAKMVILNADHPDVFEYVWCKAREERKAWSLVDLGYDGSVDGEAYSSVFFQNSNNSVRVNDEFMQAVIDDGDWHLRAITDNSVVSTVRARDLMRAIAEAAHQCGDPGMQFDTTVNNWHTCSNTARINASNPCSEYMFLDDSACNLASLNLRRFQTDDGELDAVAFRRAASTMILAQEIIVDNAKYPTERIAENSLRFRPLGLGYANLGALLMSRGLPYDSDAGRAYAAAITALMHGEANRVSALIAADRGAFEGYAVNAEPMLKVMEQHRSALDGIDEALVPYELMETTRQVWDDVIELGKAHGYRNAQVTVLAPTGTIGFMMDCDTTGVEPDIALVKYKKLVGGGMLKIVNNTVGEALSRLGYNSSDTQAIVDYIDAQGTIEGAPKLLDEHLAVFDCAFRAQKGTRTIDWRGHIRMMGAVQPFLSGAISKTINMPNEASVEEIEEAYLEAWRQGLKAVAIYRDGCKRVQPLNTGKGSDAKTSTESKSPERVSTAEAKGPPQAVRHKLPDERRSLTHKFSIGGHEGYLTIGMYEDGRPGEIFIRMAKEGSTISGLMDSFATGISLALQHGVPINLLVDKFSHTRFEPSGFSDNRSIGYAKSIMDYIFRWIGQKFPDGRYAEQQTLPGIVDTAGHGNAIAPAKGSQLGLAATPTLTGRESDGGSFVAEMDAPACHVCGTIMVRSGACHKCANCGATSGCS